MEFMSMGGAQVQEVLPGRGREISEAPTQKEQSQWIEDSSGKILKVRAAKYSQREIFPLSLSLTRSQFFPMPQFHFIEE